MFDYEKIEAGLQARGATPSEAAGLTDILHLEGWGGREYENPLPLDRMLWWYREFRNAETTV